MNAIKGQEMTDFMNFLPPFVKFSPEEWDDYMGMNLQGLILIDPSDGEKNEATVNQVNIAKQKGWPVLTIRVDDFGVTAPKTYDGINLIKQLDKHRLFFIQSSSDQKVILNKKAISIDIYNEIGKKVQQLKNTNIININTLPKGVYLLYINQSQTIKMSV